ncbi:MAG TPA: hypothetical protein VMY42_14435 [Thermoguttaceae bacterium]|nr:hypothetical protein [Thermoguttaceae bacterium]
MFSDINHLILRITDPVLGWLLHLPSDAALFIIGIGTGAILTLARPLTTNQDLLRRCGQDKRRLKELIREAKRRRDKDALRRHRAVKGLVAMTALRSEGLPLAVALVPIALLGTWCFQRLEYHPPAAFERVPMTAYFPISAAGGVVHLVPQPGLTAENGWVQEIVRADESETGDPQAVATWHLKAEAKSIPYAVEIRYREGTYTKALLVGQRTYAPMARSFDSDWITKAETRLRPVKLFGIVPGIDPLHLAPWLVAYLLIAVPSVSLVKRVCGIY